MDISTIGVKVDTTDVKRGEKDLNNLGKSAKKAEKDLADLEQGATKAANEVDKVNTSANNKSLNSFGKSAKTAAAQIAIFGAAVAGMQKYADGFTVLQNGLMRSAKTLEEHNATMSALVKTSAEVGVGLKSSIDLYTKMRNSVDKTKVSNEKLLRVNDLIQKNIVLSGASAQTASGALFQLSQAFSNGALRGEEYNSVLDGMPTLLDNIAVGIGITTDEIRNMANKGKLTTDTIIDALLKSGEAIDAEMKGVKLSMEQTFSALTSQIGLVVSGIMGANDGLTGTFANIAKYIEENKDELILYGITAKAVISRTIDVFDLLAESVVAVFAAVGSYVVQGWSESADYVMAGVVKLAHALNSVGFVDTKTVASLEMFKANFEAAADAAKKLRKNAVDGVNTALKKVNVTVEERVKLELQAVKAANKQAIAAGNAARAKKAEIRSTQKLLSKKTQSAQAEQEAQREAMRLQKEAHDKKIADIEAEGELALMFWQDEQKRAKERERAMQRIASGAQMSTTVENVDLSGWKEQFANASADALVSALQSGDVGGALSGLIGSLSSSFLKSGMSSITSSMMGMGGNIASGLKSGAIGMGISLAAVGIEKLLSRQSNAEKAYAKMIRELEKQSTYLEASLSLQKSLGRGGDALNTSLSLSKNKFEQDTAKALQDFARDFTATINLMQEKMEAGQDNSEQLAQIEELKAKYKEYTDTQLLGQKLLLDATKESFTPYELLAKNLENGVISAKEYNKSLNSIAASYETYATDILQNRSEIDSAANAFNGIYKELTGINLLESGRIERAVKDVENLIGDSFSKADYLDYIRNLAIGMEEYGTSIDKLSAQLTSSNKEAVIAAVDSLENLSNMTFASSVDALNYMNSLKAVGDMYANGITAGDAYTSALAGQANTILGLAAKMNGTYAQFQNEIAASTINAYYDSLGAGGVSSNAAVIAAYQNATAADLQAWAKQSWFLQAPQDVKEAIYSLIQSGNSYQNAVNNTTGNRPIGGAPRPTSSYTSATNYAHTVSTNTTAVNNNTQAVEKASRVNTDTVRNVANTFASVGSSLLNASNNIQKDTNYKTALYSAEMIARRIQSGSYTEQDATRFAQYSTEAMQAGSNYFGQSVSMQDYTQREIEKAVYAARLNSLGNIAQEESTTLTNVVDALEKLYAMQNEEKAKTETFQEQLLAVQEELLLLRKVG